MTLLINIALGVLPAIILGASFAAGIEDDRPHRRMFLFVYGLWAITLAMWNWMRSAPNPWIVLWLVAGVGALVWSRALRVR
jgi:uncharacterized membrane protein YqgA involved in biofilm formation